MLQIPTTNLQRAQLAEALKYRWDINARPKQKAPAGDWFIWIILAGRGFGKTRTGGEQVRIWVKDNPYVNLIGATADDARDIMIDGESGILAICPRSERPMYKKSERRLDWPNGAKSLVFTADEPERLRGKQHMKLWADELRSWRYPESWDQAMMGLRLGNNPQGIVTTTPRATKLIKDLIADKRNVITKGTTYENKANLALGFFDYVITRYEGTRLGRQELNAEILEDVEGALWKRLAIDNNRNPIDVRNMERVVVGVDPSGSTTGDEAGIITAGKIGEHHYTMADDSLQGSPVEWAMAAIAAYHRSRADCIVAEGNYGGEMVRTVIKQIDPTVNVKMVSATRGKAVRAEPISALCEQGKDHHMGTFPILEDELCLWLPGDKSPNRLDAKVWADTELMSRIRSKARTWRG